MKINSDILIPTEVILEWQNGTQDGLLTNQWWNSLTQEQQKQMLEFCLNFLRNQNIKRTRLRSNSLINSLQNQGIGCLELTQKEHTFLLSGKIKQDSYGVIGQCYSQHADFVGDVCKRDLGNYFIETDNHKCGQQTVDIICCAINSLPGLIAAPTPVCSVADVGLKWDVIIEWNNFYFPLQVKSSFQGIQEAMKNGHVSSYAKEMISLAYIPIDKLQETEFNRKNIDNYWRKKVRQAKILHQSGDIQTTVSNYRNSTPIYIWSNHNKETLRSLVILFANTFKIDQNLEQYQEQAIEDYLDKYPPRHSIRMGRRKLYHHDIEELKIKKRYQIQEIIQKLQDQINIRDEQINNYKADKLPITLSKQQALQVASDALNYVQELVKNEQQKMWYKSSDLLEKVQNLINIDRKDNSIFIKKTEELLHLAHQFTEIQTSLKESDLEVDDLGNMTI